MVVDVDVFVPVVEVVLAGVVLLFGLVVVAVVLVVVLAVVVLVVLVVVALVVDVLAVLEVMLVVVVLVRPWSWWLPQCGWQREGCGIGRDTGCGVDG